MKVRAPHRRDEKQIKEYMKLSVEYIILRYDAKINTITKTGFLDDLFDSMFSSKVTIPQPPLPVAFSMLTSEKTIRYFQDVRSGFCSVWDKERQDVTQEDPVLLASLISDILISSAPSVAWNISPLLLGVLIAKIGVEEFCQKQG